jgi:hypothetical protein
MLTKVLEGYHVRDKLREALTYHLPMHMLETLCPYQADMIPMRSENEMYTYGIIQGCFCDERALDPKLVHLYNRRQDTDTVENLLTVHNIEYHKEYGRIFIGHIMKLKEVQMLFRPNVAEWFESCLTENLFDNPGYTKCHQRNVLKHECHSKIYDILQLKKRDTILSNEQRRLMECGQQRGFFNWRGIDRMFFIGCKRTSTVPMVEKSSRILTQEEEEYAEQLFSDLHLSNELCRLPYIMCLLKRKFRHLNQTFSAHHLQQYERVWKRKRAMSDTTYIFN